MSTSDPLSFLAADNSDTSDSGSDDEEHATRHKSSSIIDTETRDNLPDKGDSDDLCSKLPNPEIVLANKIKPSFFKDSDEDYFNIIDWEKISDQVHSSARAMHKKVPGHAALNSASSNVVTAEAVKYSADNTQTVKDSNDGDRDVSTGKDTANAETYKDNINEDVRSVTKRKTADTAITYRQKEKRKRDIGQSSRGKSYVEEEKRILRQTYHNS